MCPVRGIKAYRGSRVVTPLILNLGGGRKLGVSIMLRPFYPQERTRDLLSRWLGGAWTFWGIENLLFLPGFEPRIVQPVA
jgi:hypothetical protein